MLMNDNTEFIPVKDPNMSPVRVQNERLSMEQRLTTFQEVEHTYTEAQALEEASRCLKCPTHWCQKACPAGVPVTDFIAAVRAGDYEGAYQLISSASTLPEICSRVCPQEKQCQSNCTRSIRSQAVGIGRLERFVVEQHYASGAARKTAAPTGKKIAVVGSGPSGLSAAQKLADLGHSVTVFERSARPGGLLMYGIPNMKIEKGLLERKIAAMEAQGVSFRTGAAVTSSELTGEYDAVILAVGTGNARKLQIAGAENASGICMAVDYLTAATKSLSGGEAISAKDKQVIIIGGGDTGSDCVGTAIRQGCASVCQIEMLQRYPKKEHIFSPFPAKVAEQKFDASQEECMNVFCVDPHLYQTTVKAVQTDAAGAITSVTIVSLTPVQQGRRTVMQEVPGTERQLPCDLLIIAAGFIGPEAKLAEAFGVETDGATRIKGYATNVPGVYACGDCRTGQSLVVKAMVDGRDCALFVDSSL